MTPTAWLFCFGVWLGAVIGIVIGCMIAARYELAKDADLEARILALFEQDQSERQVR
jgi:hypothetical protein